MTTKKYKTINGIYKATINNLNKGEEQSINDIIYFGVGTRIYAWVDYLIQSNINYTTKEKSAFGYVKIKELKTLIKYIKETDGFLYINK